MTINFIYLFFSDVLRWNLVNSSKKEEHCGFLHLGHSHGHCQPELLYFREKWKSASSNKDSQGFRMSRHVILYGGIPEVAMRNYRWLCNVCNCICGKIVIEGMGVCLSTWHCVICTVQSVRFMQDLTAVLAADAHHSQFIFLFYSDPQRNKNNTGKQ